MFDLKLDGKENLDDELIEMQKKEQPIDKSMLPRDDMLKGDQDHGLSKLSFVSVNNNSKVVEIPSVTKKDDIMRKNSFHLPPI